VLNIVDDVTRECLRAVPDTSISGRRVVRELTALIAERGKPGMIVSDNGTELTSNAVLAWCGEIGVEWHYIAPGKPMQNGYIESFMYGRLLRCKIDRVDLAVLGSGAFMYAACGAALFYDRWP